MYIHFTKKKKNERNTYVEASYVITGVIKRRTCKRAATVNTYHL